MRFLGWLFIILSVQAVSCLAHEIFSARRNRGFGLFKHLTQELGVDGVTGTRSLRKERGEKGYQMLKQAKVYIRSGHPGKGGKGGANIVHHRPDENRRNEAVPKRSAFLNTFLCVGLVWSMSFPSYFSR